MHLRRFYYVLTLCMALASHKVNGQIKGDILQNITDLIYKDSIDRASELLDRSVNLYSDKNDWETRSSFIYPQGKIELLKNNGTNFPKAIALYQNIQKSASQKAKYSANIALSLLLNDQGGAQKAYEYAQKANELAYAAKDVQMLLESEFYLSEFGMKMGDFNLLEEHNSKSVKILKDNHGTKFNLAPRVYNYKASLMHFTAKTDSANYYFEMAMDALDELEDNPETRYYLPASIYGNWVMVKQSEGDFETAMEYSLEGVRKYNAFLASTKNHPLTARVHGNLSIYYRNIGSLYNDMGDKQKAKQFAGIGYRHAKANFLPNTVNYFTAMLMMAEAHVYTSEPETAQKYLEEAQVSLNTIAGENVLWHAQLASIYAEYYFKLNDYKKAIRYFKSAHEQYEISQPDGYDQNQLYNLMNLSKSYAYNNQPDLAMSSALKIYEYSKRIYGEFGLLTNETLLSLAQVAYINKDYKSALDFSQQNLDLFKEKKDLQNLNKLYFEGNKSWVLLLHAKSKFALLKEKNVKVLLPIIMEIDEAIKLLETRKTFVSTDDEIGDFISNNLEVFDFAKKLNAEAYFLSKDPKYLNEIIQLHESSIYNRIRARLNLKNPEIAQIPTQIRNREKILKDSINQIFSSIETYNEIDINSYRSLTITWNLFIDSLKLSYPEYYKMRYASLKEDISDLQNDIPEKTTVVRYLFIDEKLYVLVADRENRDFIALDCKKHNPLIEKLNGQNIQIEELSKITFSLYNQLWRPLEAKIRHRKVIIIPDADLFNLSFELLTQQKIKTFNDLAIHSLLSKKVISYNYSLLLLNQKNNILDFKNDFVAYVPGFDAKMKQDYQIAITDTLNLDHTYLRLLPQPFSADLIKKFTKRFNGSSFLNQYASKQIFGNTAKEHKIIHIGTHAESNNINPELSRLVFAKNISDSLKINDNYLYAYEIYNQNLNSNLAILTACETGKPTYQSGEGMISLAHAFNYAGSKSILTSLWQIDEQSSSQIVDSFYNHLEDGLPKDEALQKAKLDYLVNAEGRTLHPKYWAGLVLMGETTPIDLISSLEWTWWVLIVMVSAIIFLAVYRIKKDLPNSGRPYP